MLFRSHQAVKEVAPGFRVTARSSDGVIEAMESTECKSMMGWACGAFLGVAMQVVVALVG